MAYDPINTGALPNDNTGTPNRDAWTMANAMFLELYTLAAAAAVASVIEEQLAILAQTDADTAAALALKADATELATKANVADVPRFDTAQTITNLERLQLAENAGLFVTVPFELLNPTIPLDGTWLFELPRLPNNFILKDASLTAHLCTHLLGDIEFLAELNHSDLPVLAQANNVPLPVNGVCPMVVTADAFRVNGGTPLKLTFTSTAVVGSGAGFALGLTLWLRGVWES